MLGSESVLIVADNSGIRTVKCLKFLNGLDSNKKGTLGDMTVVSLFNYKGYKKKSKRKVFLGIVVSVKNWNKQKTGIYVRANQNRVVLLENKEKMLGKVVKGPVSINVRKQKENSKILLLAKHLY